MNVEFMESRESDTSVQFAQTLIFVKNAKSNPHMITHSWKSSTPDTRLLSYLLLWKMIIKILSKSMVKECHSGSSPSSQTCMKPFSGKSKKANARKVSRFQDFSRDTVHSRKENKSVNKSQWKKKRRSKRSQSNKRLHQRSNKKKSRQRRHKRKLSRMIQNQEE